jgi:hypothetical protein
LPGQAGDLIDLIEHGVVAATAAAAAAAAGRSGAAQGDADGRHQTVMQAPQHRQMQPFDKAVTPRPALAMLRAWPCLAAACLAGLQEWAALCRSRGVDAWRAQFHPRQARMNRRR